MSKPIHPLKATMMESPTRWQVTSASRPGMLHVVDLESWWHFGECSCEHFQFRIAPLLARKQNPGEPCAHILCARTAHSLWSVRAITRQRKLAIRKTRNTQAQARPATDKDHE